MNYDYSSPLTFLHREDGSVDFVTDSYVSYQNGFGDEKEFWLGLELIHTLTTFKDWGLRIELETWTGEHYWAEYDHFSVGSEDDWHRAYISGYNPNSTTPVDSLGGGEYSIDGLPFSANNRDQDGHDKNCAKDRAGWWYRSSKPCDYIQPLNKYGNVADTEPNSVRNKYMRYDVDNIQAILKTVTFMLLPKAT